MIYIVQKLENEFLENAYRQAMSELNEFYERKWTYGLPRIFIVPDRATMNSVQERETPQWVRATNINGNIFILDNEMVEQESSHKKLSNEEYAMSIKHELSHSFFFKLSKWNSKPFWLMEGVPLYTSGQSKSWKKPETLDCFLESYEDCPGRNFKMDKEFAFAVALLVENFGKHKLLDLIRSLATADTQEKFNTSFRDIYGFDPTYCEFTKLYQSQNN